jgi:hypothetical protein
MKAEEKTAGRWAGLPLLFLDSSFILHPSSFSSEEPR